VSGFTVVALAGGELEEDFRRAGYRAVNKAYLPVAGEVMLVRVLRALRAARAVTSIRCVTPRDAFAALPGAAGLCDALVAPGPDAVTSLLAGMAGLGDAERVLVCATDMPLISPAAIDGFAALAERTPCDIGYGFVERRAHEARFSGVRHTWVRLREGTFCGSGVSVLRVGAATAISKTLQAFMAARKSPPRLAALFSPRLVLAALLGRLSIRELERRADELTGLVCRGILCPYPELAVNVDRLSDLRTAEHLLRQTT
jgi:molybdopterin-guanine dinucleotide biosynthesis protein A